MEAAINIIKNAAISSDDQDKAISVLTSEDALKINNMNNPIAYIQSLLSRTQLTAQQEPTSTQYLIPPNKKHGVVDPRAIKVEGLSNLSSPTVLRRTQIIDKILEETINNHVLLVRSPPYTGKTALCQLMVEHLKSFDIYVRYVSILWFNDEKSFADNWTRHTGRSFNAWIDLANEEEVILIVDECQILYDTTHQWFEKFWPKIKASPIKMKIILFASYGEHSTTYSSISTRVDIPHYNGDIDLLYSEY